MGGIRRVHDPDIIHLKKAAKKFFFVVRPLRGGGVKARPLRKNNFFAASLNPGSLNFYEKVKL